MEKDDLKHMIETTVPFIYVVAPDMELFMDEFDTKYGNDKEKKNVWEWSLGTGLRLRGTKEVSPTTQGFVPALKEIEKKIGQQEKTILIIRDVPQLCGSSAARPQPDLMAMSTMQEMWRKTKIIFMFVHTCNILPPDWQRTFMLIEWPLPSKEELEDMYRKIEDGCVSIKKKFKVLSEDEMHDVISASQGLTKTEVSSSAGLSLNKYGNVNVEMLRDIKKQIIYKTGFLDYVGIPENMDNVGGMDDLKFWLKSRKNIFTSEAEKFGLDKPKGLMLVGIPGVGKSLACKAMASIWGLPMIRLDIGKLFSSTVGSSESNTRNVLATIEAIAPCVLFIDEMEKGLSGVQSSNFSDGGTSARVVGTFLSWMQDKKSDVILVATANNISLLPPELKRSGRWDGIFFVDLPDEIERMAIFAIHLIKRKRDPKKYNLEQLMQATNNFTGAEIEQVVKTALVMAFYEKKELDDTHLIKAVRDTVPIYETAREDIEFLRDWVHINKDGQGTRAMLAKRKVV